MNGKITGAQAKNRLLESKFSSSVLHKIWNLSSIRKDGSLDVYEFALALHFIKMKTAGLELPTTLPAGWEQYPAGYSATNGAADPGNNNTRV